MERSPTTNISFLSLEPPLTNPTSSPCLFPAQVLSITMAAMTSAAAIPVSRTTNFAPRRASPARVVRRGVIASAADRGECQSLSPFFLVFFWVFLKLFFGFLNPKLDELYEGIVRCLSARRRHRSPPLLLIILSFLSFHLVPHVNASLLLTSFIPSPLHLRSHPPSLLLLLLLLRPRVARPRPLAQPNNLT